MMYYYWVHHGIRPSVFYNIPEREKVVIRAFYEYELKQKNDKSRKIDSSGSPVFPVTIV
ncbi:hypothetical protein [Clostridium carboxidivorans]|uniref:hypothetical protein n=1 Tax=Clostridium carboxidivorans TaxID=217159 RepID=UPI000AE5CF4B|nr:hypothetical protein [Clostridium carboxidivorans]